MFERFGKKIAEKVGHGVKQSIEPVRTEVKKTVDSKVDLYSRILRLGILIFLFIDGTKRVADYTRDSQNSPNHIIINNYLVKKEGED